MHRPTNFTAADLPRNDKYNLEKRSVLLYIHKYVVRTESVPPSKVCVSDTLQAVLLCFLHNILV